MVGSLSAIFCIAILYQISFMLYGIKHKANSDKAFLAISIISIAMLIAHAMNMQFIGFGEWGILVAKILYSLYISLFITLVVLLIFIKTETFSSRTRNIALIKFIVVILGCIILACLFINVFDNRFFTYTVRDINFLTLISKQTPRIVVWYPGQFWNILVFLWVLIASIYGLLNLTRIIMRGAVNSINELILIVLFTVFSIFFIIHLNNPHILIFGFSLSSLFFPLIYYCLIYEGKNWFMYRSFRSKLFDQSSKIMVIFNADDLLVDFNQTAQNFFGFTSKDILNFNINDFIKDYVPLGNVPSDSLSLDQIAVKAKNEERVICQLDYKRLTSFKKITVCSFFTLTDISTIVQSFTEIQQASMVDHITGLLAQHVLMKKIREINIFRRFPYSAACCSINIKNPRPELNEDFALVKVSECIKNKIRGTDFASYENGTIVLLFPAEYNVAKNVVERIVSAIEDEEYLRNEINFQFGLTSKESPDEDIQQTINRAHAIMFKSKIEASIHGLSTLQN